MSLQLREAALLARVKELERDIAAREAARTQTLAAYERMRVQRTELEEALKEAIEFQNDDTECLQASDPGGFYLGCPDERCKIEGCMVARVNRWREALAGRDS